MKTSNFEHHDQAYYDTVSENGDFSMNERWSEQLHCRQCGNTGLVSMSQPKGSYVPVVDVMPSGFKVVTLKYGIKFECGACEVEVAE